LVEGSLAIKPPELIPFLPRPTLDTRPPFARAQTLPFRLPSYSAPYSPPASAYSEHSPHSIPSPASATVDRCRDDDEMMTDALDPAPPPPFKMPVRPLKLKHDMSLFPPSPHPTPSTARIPTPIHPFFPSTPSPHMSGGGGYPGGLSPNVPAWLLAGHSPGGGGHHAMPSPIREDAVDAQLSKLSVGDHPMELEEAALTSPLSDGGGNGLPRVGRARSGAITTVNRRIFTGYVADCEKCRNKVPGHYIHFLPS
jgi:hypothetical protein